MEKLTIEDAKRADALLKKLKGDTTLSKEDFLGTLNTSEYYQNENISKILIQELYIKVNDGKYSLDYKGFFVISKKKYGFVSKYNKSIIEKIIAWLTLGFTAIALFLQILQMCKQDDKVGISNTNTPKTMSIDSIHSKNHLEQLNDTSLKSQ